MVSAGSVKFLRIFLKQKTTKYSVLFIWNIAFETLVICEVEIVFWKEMLLYYFRQVFWHQYAQRFLSLSFEVPHTLKYPSGCTQQCFLVAKKKYPVSWNRCSKDSANHVFNFFQLFHQYSTKLFNFFDSILWYNIQTQKPLHIQCFWFSLLNQVCFRICNSEIFFFVLAFYCLQLITHKQ